jgi:HipA-like C-terminal domain
MAEHPFPEVDVSDWEVVRDETSGAEEKAWVRSPDTGQDWLYKAVTVKDGHVHGEDWAEKAAAHLAGLVGVPCARIELATRGTSRGSISLDLCPKLFDLQEGRMLLEGCPGYVHQSGPRGSRPGHSLENIRSVLDGAAPPPGWAGFADATAFDVFAGYVVLDAWIANTDRHPHNWAVLRHATEAVPLRLSGSYDHASCLGFGVLDSRRSMMLGEPGGIERWCKRGLARCFEHTLGLPIPTLVDAAKKALDLASPAAREHWPGRLAQVSDEDVRRIVIRIPGMSDPARTFAVSVLEVNRRRVLDACT